jgi:hypothetical protein
MPRDRAGVLLPPCLFATAVVFFMSALVALPLVVGTLADHFYHPHVLAVTHMLTLGWISTAMIGVLYRYVPGLTKRPLPLPRVAVLQAATFALGVVGLVAYLALGRWQGTILAAAVLVVSIALFCANVWPLVLRGPGRGVAEVGILVATASLVLAAVLGMIFALDKHLPFLGGSLLTNLAAHVHLAAVGWVGTTICALSFRFLPAFLLPEVDLTHAARRQVLLMAGGVALLVAALLGRSRFVPLAAAVVALAIVRYLALLVRLVRTRRMPIDWTARHALASAVWLALTLLGGVVLAASGGEHAFGARLAGAYGVAGLLGWMSNILIGVSYKLFPGFVAAARAERGRRALPVADLGVSAWARPAVLVLFNGGVAVAVLGLLAGRVPLATAGTIGIAAAGLLYGTATARTLAFTVLEPRRPVSPLAVLP